MAPEMSSFQSPQPVGVTSMGKRTCRRSSDGETIPAVPGGPDVVTRVPIKGWGKVRVRMPRAATEEPEREGPTPPPDPEGGGRGPKLRDTCGL